MSYAQQVYHKTKKIHDKFNELENVHKTCKKNSKKYLLANAKKAVMLFLKPIGFPAASGQICGGGLNLL